MRTIEQYWNDFEDRGFVRVQTPRGCRFIAPPHLGEGYFELWGDLDTCFATISDLTFTKPFIMMESCREKLIELGQMYQGEVSYFQKKTDLYPVEVGLNYWVNFPNYLMGYKRMEPGVRLFNTGICYREKFFDTLPYELPEDFWETATSVLNPDVVDLPSVTAICEQIRICRLSGVPSEMFIHGKCLEVFALTLEHIYTNRKPALMHLSAQDRAGLEEIKALFWQHMKNPPTLQNLAAIVGMNQRKLMTAFKQLNGVTVYGYLKRIRMEKALELLQKNEISITKIACEVGYHGDGHFQQAFREVYGTTPSKLRKEAFAQRKSI